MDLASSVKKTNKTTISTVNEKAPRCIKCRHVKWAGCSGVNDRMLSTLKDGGTWAPPELKPDANIWCCVCSCAYGFPRVKDFINCAAVSMLWNE